MSYSAWENAIHEKKKRVSEKVLEAREDRERKWGWVMMILKEVFFREKLHFSL